MGSRMCSGPVEQFKPMTIDRHAIEDGQRSRCIGAEQHPSGGIQRDLRLDWQAYAGLLKCLLDPQ